MTATWRTASGDTGVGTVAPAGSPDTGIMYFFTPDNWEVMVKVLDGCGLNDRFWVFAAATTDVGYTITVTDTQTGLVKEYTNAIGSASAAVTDTDAFASCL